MVFALPIVFSAIQCLLLLLVFRYETPKFLKQTNRYAELNELMGKIYEVDRISQRIDAIVVSSGSKAKGVSYRDTFCNPKYRYATLVGCVLAIFKRLTGINAVLFYSSQIFNDIGWSSRGGTALVGFVNLASTFVAVVLLGSKFNPC